MFSTEIAQSLRYSGRFHQRVLCNVDKVAAAKEYLVRKSETPQNEVTFGALLRTTFGEAFPSLIGSRTTSSELQTAPNHSRENTVSQLPTRRFRRQSPSSGSLSSVSGQNGDDRMGSSMSASDVPLDAVTTHSGARAEIPGELSAVSQEAQQLSTAAQRTETVRACVADDEEESYVKHPFGYVRNDRPPQVPVDPETLYVKHPFGYVRDDRPRLSGIRSSRHFSTATAPTSATSPLASSSVEAEPLPHSRSQKQQQPHFVGLEIPLPEGLCTKLDIEVENTLRNHNNSNKNDSASAVVSLPSFADVHDWKRTVLISGEISLPLHTSSSPSSERATAATVRKGLSFFRRVEIPGYVQVADIRAKLTATPPNGAPGSASGNSTSTTEGNTSTSTTLILSFPL